MISEEKKYRIADYNTSVFAFSEIGKGKVENQDSFQLYFDGVQLIVVVADGLGSAAFSKEGSKKIVAVAIDILSHTDSYENVASEILKSWRTGIEGNLNQYDTTLKFVKITKNKVIYGGVGDGWIAFSTPDGLISLTADNSFSNQTDSILSFDLNRKFVIEETCLATIRVGLISTDGFSEDMDTDNARQMLNEIEEELSVNENAFINEMKQTLENWPVETNRDDKTVVFIKSAKEEN